MRAQESGRHEVDGAAKEYRQLVLERDECESGDGVRVELDEYVEIAIRPIFTPKHRAEQRKAADSIPFA